MMASYRSVLLEVTLVWMILGLRGFCWAEEGRESHVEGIKKVEKFGCVFENEEFYVPTSSVHLPVYGEAAKPMEFGSLAEFEEVLNVMKAEYSKVMADFVYSTMPGFYDFYDVYNKSHSKEPDANVDFPALFKNYVPKFFPNNDPTAITIQLLERLLKIYPNMRHSLHLVPANNWILKTLSSGLGIYSRWQQKNNTIFGVPSHQFYIDHDAGLLRFRLEGKRIGYVLMDPASIPPCDRPVVVMEDEEFPHQAAPYKQGFMEFSFYLPQRDYLLANRQQGIFPSKTLYYIGRPYCSFRMTTTKPRVLFPPLLTIRKDATALQKITIGFNPLEIPAEYKVETYRSYDDGSEGTFQYEKRHEKDKESQELLENTIRTMDFPNFEELLVKGENIAKDEEFKTLVKNLQAQFFSVMIDANPEEEFQF